MSGEWRKLDLRISGPESLAEAGDALHDALFAEEDAAYDQARGLFSLTAWREVPELARRERTLLLLARVRTPRVRTALELHSVNRATIQKTDRYGISEYCLEKITYDPAENLIRIQIMGPLKIQLHVDTLSGMVSDIGEPTWDAPDMLTMEPFHWHAREQEK